MVFNRQKGRPGANTESPPRNHQETNIRDRVEPDYMSAAKKYNTSIHITPEYLENFPILNVNNSSIVNGKSYVVSLLLMIVGQRSR